MSAEADTLALLGHELRTPVASIRAAASALRERGDALDAATRERLVAIVDEQAQLLARLLDDVLAASRLERGALPVEARACDVAAIVRGIAEAAAARSRERAVRYSGPDASNALADPDRLRQLLGNLVENALRHGEGTVVVELAEAGGVVTVSVEDEGPGVADADRERIFARYERADTRSAGTGLGLWLARELAERMGGTLVLTGSPGGARFELRLPAP